MSMKYDISGSDDSLVLGGVELSKILKSMNRILTPIVSLLIVIIFIMMIYLVHKFRQVIYIEKVNETTVGETSEEASEGYQNPTQMMKLVENPFSGSEAMAVGPVSDKALREYAYSN